MNKRPITYFQTDPRWKKLPYRVPGEDATIGGSGCGPTAAAMAIETLTGHKFTPVDACQWAVDHGYKALNQGTYYSYFVPQFRAFGIECRQMLKSSLHNDPTNSVHARVKEYIRDGNYAIALMGPGTWTKGGHYVLVWDWNAKVRINDPASTKDKRLNGDPDAFKREVKQYWMIDAQEFNKGDEDMTQDEFNEMFAAAMQQYRQTLRDNDCGDWSEAARRFVVERGIFAGGDPGPDGQPNYMWEDLLTREQAAQLLYAFAIKCGLV